MIGALLTLLLCQLAGELVARAAGLPVPGPVLGFLILAVILGIRGGAWPALKATSTTLLSHLSLLFVPAGVGVLLYVDRLAEDGLIIVAALIVSTVLTLVVTAAVFEGVARLQGPPPADRDEPS